MAIEDVLSRISAIQARFGVNGFAAGTSEFESLLSDAARHAGIAPTDRIDDTSVGEVAAADVPDGATSDGSAAAAGSDADDVTTTTNAPAAESAAEAGPATDVVSILDDPGVVSGALSGEAMEAVSAAAAPALTAAAALGGTGPASLLDALTGQLGAEGGAAVLASIIAQQQAGAGIIRDTAS